VGVIPRPLPIRLEVLNNIVWVSVSPI